jgi:preprotein translocase subunit SecF
MRRLWAHILIAFTALVAVFAVMPTLIKSNSFSTNGNYDRSRQFVFQLSERENDEGESSKLDKDSAKRMADIMEQRLISYGVTSYDIQTSGDNEISDIVTVTFYATSDTKYRQVAEYLTFSGSFALLNNQDDVVTDAQFKNGSAYKKSVSVNEYPTVILPIKTDYTEWETLTTHASENPITEEASSEEEEAKTYSRLWLIYNYEEGENYTILKDESKKLDEKTLLVFDFEPDNIDSLYYDSSKNSLAQVCGYEDSNGNGVADPNEVKAAYDRADFLVNLFNASALEYEVKCIKGIETNIYVDASVEAIKSEGNIRWTSALRATFAALIIVIGLLFFFYRLGALSVAVTTISSIFFAFLFMVTAGLEYNALALVAFVVIGVVSTLSGVIYLTKLKEDAYRGHTLKKANTEASKKSLLPIIDINIVALVIGLMCYLLGGSALHSFGSILTFGSFISLLINTLGLKGLMWLSTNATALSGKYEVFGIIPENVPNHMAEEKQRYFGRYADTDATKNKKKVGIVAAAGFVVGLVGIIVSASLSGGNLLKQPVSKATGTQLYVTNKYENTSAYDKKSTLDEKTLVSEVLSQIELQTVNADGTKTYSPLDKKNDKGAYIYIISSDFDTFVINTSKTVEGLTTYYSETYYIVDIRNVSLDNDARIAGESETDVRKLSVVITELADTIGYKISLKTNETFVKQASPDWQKITLATSIAILILTVYLMIRYRLSRGLASLIFPVAVMTMIYGILGLLSVIGLTIPATSAIAAPIGAILTYVFMIIIMNRERELVIDDKSRDTSVEHRKELSIKALGMALTPVYASAILGIFLLIDFWWFGVLSESYAYLAAIIAGLIALALVIVLFVPCANFLFKLFSNVKIKPLFRRKSKNKKAAVKKSAEPEEAIFIGIND